MTARVEGYTCAMEEKVIPILRVRDAAVAVTWYNRLGFHQVSVHRFAPHLPAFVTIERGPMRLFLSEHQGDARPDTLLYLQVRDVYPIAREFGATVADAPWGYEVEIRDPDANRLRIGMPKDPPSA
jgi:catechol 2,3-dioxygenase-like lactoylglutathione lyase family enzyme